MDEDIDQKTNTIGYELNKSTKDLFSKLKIGIKKNLGKSFDKVGGSVVKGLNVAVSLPTKLIGSVGIKWVAPAIIIFFLVFVFIFSISQTSGNTPALVPKIDSSNENVGETPQYGEITMTDDGKRIKSCGVGMEADFKRRSHTTTVSLAVLAGGGYDKQLEETIGDQFGKRCGVVYAAQYLAYDFGFWVPYSSGAGKLSGKYNSKGLNPDWGNDTGDSKHPKKGLDCTGFVSWASINGYGGLAGSSGAISFGNCEAIKAAIQPGDTITMPSGEPYHVVLVLEYDNQRIKFAHSGGYSGTTTGWIDICTGQGEGMQFGYLHKKTY